MRTALQQFTRDDGRVIPIIPGFRKQVLAAPRVSVQPKPEWTEADYQAAADKKVRHLQDFIDEFIGHGGVLEGANVIELGCGAGIDCLLIALRAVRSVVGIDLELPLFDPGDKGERTRRLTRDVLALVGESTDIDAVLSRLPLRFATTDAKQMAFPDDSFDLLWSRAAMEHIVPPQDALAEMARVVRPGGLIYHAIDPFYWLKGCHKRGVTDIPWAHARLAPSEYYRFLAETEGESTAKKSARHLQTLNQLTPRQWRATLSARFEILQWTEERWPMAETLLEQYPDVGDTLLAGVEPGDLTCRSIKVWMRK